MSRFLNLITIVIFKDFQWFFKDRIKIISWVTSLVDDPPYQVLLVEVLHHLEIVRDGVAFLGGQQHLGVGQPGQQLLHQGRVPLDVSQLVLKTPLLVLRPL